MLQILKELSDEWGLENRDVGPVEKRGTSVSVLDIWSMKQWPYTEVVVWETDQQLITQQFGVNNSRLKWIQSDQGHVSLENLDYAMDKNSLVLHTYEIKVCLKIHIPY